MAERAPAKRIFAPSARVDSQRADFPPTASSFASTIPYGSPSHTSLSSSRPRRPSPKSAGSASLPSKPPERAESWERDTRQNSKSNFRSGPNLKRLEMTPRAEEGPFSDPLRRAWGGSNSDVESIAPLSPGENPFFRRGSAISSTSAFSSPLDSSFPGRHGGSSSLSASRHSISSFGGYTMDVAGDASNASFPLLATQYTRDSYGGTSSMGARSRPSSREGEGPGWARHRTQSLAVSPFAGGGSTYAQSLGGSDTSSVHSYPPRPRQRTRSTAGSSDQGEGGLNRWGGWAPEIERTGATGQIKREKTKDSQDMWPAFVEQSYIHQPIARPAATYQSLLSSYSFPAPSTRTPDPPLASPTSINHLGPLRKRLARSISTAGTSTDVQLLLELIDALENCITSFAAPAAARASHDSTTSSILHSSVPPTALSPHTDALAPSPVSQSSFASALTSRSHQSLVDEVRFLIRELLELVPDAQRCLAAGTYGPLARPSASTKTLLQSLQVPNAAVSASPDWWPRRLARDCRTLLAEAGLPTGTGPAAWLLAAHLQGDKGNETTRGGGEEGQGGTEGPVQQLPRTLQADPSAPMSEERKEELLQEGKQRWADYRAKQSVLEQSSEGPT
ncbi:hypothetical protein JCM11641_007455 [Rhodosporidiobolus odoratus]